MKHIIFKVIQKRIQTIVIFSTLLFISSCHQPKDDDTKKIKEYNVYIPATSAKIICNLEDGKVAVTTITDSLGNTIPEVLLKPVGETEKCWKCKNGTNDCKEIPCPVLPDCKKIACTLFTSVAEDKFNPKEQATYNYILAPGLKINP